MENNNEISEENTVEDPVFNSNKSDAQYLNLIYDALEVDTTRVSNSILETPINELLVQSPDISASDSEQTVSPEFKESDTEQTVSLDSAATDTEQTVSPELKESDTEQTVSLDSKESEPKQAFLLNTAAQSLDEPSFKAQPSREMLQPIPDESPDESSTDKTTPAPHWTPKFLRSDPILFQKRNEAVFIHEEDDYEEVSSAASTTSHDSC